jgi:hypothetical protein
MKHTRRWFVGIGILAAGGLIVGLVLRPSPAVLLGPSAEFLAPVQAIVAPAPSLFERWVPMSWGWLWRLREAMRGPRETVSIQGMVIECSTDAEQTWIRELREPVAETNGMRGWIASGLLLEKLEQELMINRGGRVLMWPRVNTSHGILSTMWSGTMTSTNISPTPVGFNFELLSEAQGGGIELKTRVSFSEVVTNLSSPSVHSIRTNLYSATRWQLPPGMGGVLVGPEGGNGSGRMAILFSVQVQRAK